MPALVVIAPVLLLSQIQGFTSILVRSPTCEYKLGLIFSTDISGRLHRSNTLEQAAADLCE